MHVLGHSFSQRRKSSTKPRDLHIRKVSFSGSSLSSGCSLSSASSTSTARTNSTERVDSHLDPLSSHPTFHAPPRLYERPFIVGENQRYDEHPGTFYNDQDDDLEDELDEQDVDEQQPTEMALPPHASPMDTNDERQEPQDYFMMTLAKRPPMPRSHWSESTIQTLDHGTPGGAAQDDDDEDVDDGLEMPSLSHRTSAMQNFNFGFSQKRGTVPKRPIFKARDSVENFIKRGGWKRRGIVFNDKDVAQNDQRGSFMS
ncbi:hypothetical protein G7046_g1394 [Stylonectria norvegica]|nr:hypothetical protein G7046_g1394 [Stylonectria norvegica]